ncbi:GAF domain-containing protein [Muricauda sp. JGD-17]|uniref:GAF domain-containing protein n=1 Tax=Flagellimonas ochracea TaxID=2696472 RepID=A0A964TAK7_9FLAO|nr:two-component regulator propeller domain-containing protein [Allomuricauda ochracea]NAY91310.1 GAF domain-containing protein [Allomuricauda ochracea]
MPTLRLFLLFQVFLICKLIDAQKFQYVYHQEGDVPFKRVNQTIQDNKGYVWLATDRGLFRFDGKYFEDHNIALRSKSIRSFLRWDDQTVLFTNDTGIHRLIYDKTDPSISYFIKASEKAYPTSLFKDSKERLWTGQMDGSIVMYDTEKSDGIVFKLVEERKTEQISFGEDKFGTLWVLIPKGGLFYFDEISKTFTVLSGHTEANQLWVKNDEVWTVGRSIDKMVVDEDQKVESSTKYKTDKEFQHIAVTSTGTIFLATETEIFTFHPQGNITRLSKVFGSNDPHRVEELPFEGINHLNFSLNEMNLNHVVWVSSNDGMCLLWSSFFQNVSGLGYDNVMGLHANSNGEVLVSQGPVHRILNQGTSASFRKENDLNGITGIVSNNTDTWYGSTAGFIYHYRQGGLVKQYDLSDRGSGIFLMSKDHTGDIWFCQATSDKPLVGVAKIDSQGKVVAYGKEKGFDSRILIIREGGRNEFYAAGIGAESYLYKYNRDQDIFENKSLPFPFKVSSNFEVHDIAIDSMGIVWMATTDGLIKYDTETVRKVDLGEFTDGEVRSIVAMPNGLLWLSTDTNGLIHLDAEGNYVVFDEKSGTPSKVAAYRCLALDSNGQLWVGTAEGLVYSSETLPGPLQTKAPMVRSILVDNEQMPFEDVIHINEQELLKLEMTTLTFPSDDIKYQYKIIDGKIPQDEIVDIPWTPVQGSYLIPKNIISGSYKLWIRAQKQGGYAWSQPTKISLKVAGKWYTSWWAILLWTLCGFLFFWYFLRVWFLKRISGLQASLHQKQTELKQKEAELVSQSLSLKDKQEELKSTGANVYLLQRLIRQIPKNATWKETMPILKKLVELPTGIDAFEIAHKRGDDIIYSGFQRGSDIPVIRQEEFNEKNDLASYVLVTGKPLTIDDYEAEASQYISGKSSRGYASRLLLPIQQAKGTPAVLCVCHREKDMFSQLDLTLIQILGAFLSASVKDELK